MSFDNKVRLTDLNYIQTLISNYYNINVMHIELIKFKDSKKQRAIYKVVTPNNNYCFKKVYYSKTDLEFLIYLMTYLYNKGIHLPKIIKTISNQYYINHNYTLFFLMSWIDGRRCSYYNDDDLKLISQNLARLHNHCNDFDYLPKTKNRYNYKNWLVDFSKKTVTLAKIYDYLHNDFRYNAASNQFFSLYSKQYHIINKSLNMLVQANFQKLLKQAVIHNNFCHSDYINKNLYISNDKVYIIDFDRAKLDISIHDLANLLRRIMRRSNIQWNFSKARLIIDSYKNIKPLNIDELRAILAYTIFPQKFYTETKRFIRNINNSLYYTERFQKIENQYKGKESFIYEFEQYYKI